MKGNGERYILMSSITYAIKAQKLLSKHGIRAFVIRDHGINNDYGCGYALKIDGTEESFYAAQRILRAGNIKFREKEECLE